MGLFGKKDKEEIDEIIIRTFDHFVKSAGGEKERAGTGEVVIRKRRRHIMRGRPRFSRMRATTQPKRLEQDDVHKVRYPRQPEQDAPALTRKGISYLNAGKLERARGLFTRALLKEPRNVTALVNKGNSYLMEGRYNLALVMYRKAEEHMPKKARSVHAAFYSNYGVALAHTGNEKEAKEMYDKAIRLNANLALIRRNKQLLLKRRKERKKVKKERKKIKKNEKRKRVRKKRKKKCLKK